MFLSSRWMIESLSQLAMSAAVRLGRPGSARRSLIMLAGAMLVASAFVEVGLLLPPFRYDEGLIVNGAQRILEGQRPYADFMTGYPPAQFYTIAAVFRIFGSSLAVERVWDALWRLAILGAAVWLARELAGKTPRLLPLGCCAILAGASGCRLYPMITATLPCLCALACLLTFLRTQHTRWVFGAGLLLGLTALYRHDLAVCLGLVMLGALRRHSPAIVWFVAGILLIVGPAVAYLVASVPGPFLREAFLDFPSVNSRARRLTVSGDLPSLLLAVGVIAFAIWEAWRVRSPRVAVLAAAAAATLILASQRFDLWHAFPALVLCLVILASSSSSMPCRGLIAIASVVYGVGTLFDLNGMLRTTGQTSNSRIVRAGVVPLPATQAAAVRYIQAHVPPGERLFVGTSTHSRVFINDALFPFLAERQQATRHDMWIPGVTNSTPVQLEIIRELERVRYVVLFDEPPSGEPNLSSVDSGVADLDDYLERRYYQVAVFGQYRILEARDQK